ncbi:hypothetical protein SDC9_05854 [bioreactor metagenome]|uniref:Uncharacterized protein n=1 Tax=bioreactor metagenome TaxID=1076179 RepID=A0A644T083_9ZZZZ|nr:hypothetical protein [Negativicutes bacterium]
MLTIDFIGLFVTILAIGIRYPHYVVIAVFVHEIGRLLMSFMVNGQLNIISATGAFGTSGINEYDWASVLILLSGPLANYIFCAVTGGVYQEKVANIAIPSAKLMNPFAVINLRLAVVSIIVSLWSFL